MDWQFICPECKIGKLRCARGKLKCEICEAKYAVEDGVPILISKNDLAYCEFLNKNTIMFDEDNTDKHFNADEWRYKNTLNLLKQASNTNTILDIGAGYGGFCHVLKERNYAVIATDANIARAKAISKRGIPYFVSLASNIPLANESMDGTCLIATLPHLPNPELVLKEISRILRPEGICVFDFYNITNLYWRIKLLLGDWQSISSRLGWHYFQSTLTKSQFLKTAQEYGLKLKLDRSYTPIPKTNKIIHPPMSSLLCVRYSFLLYKKKAG
jgi:SAM-dependent methyltransferase